MEGRIADGKRGNHIVRMMKATFALALMLTVAFAGGATAGPVLDRILKKGELVVGMSGDQPPLNVTARDGRIIGLEVDIASRLASDMGVKLRLATMPFAELLPALSEGKIDLILSGMTMTTKRNLKTAFAGPYYVTGKAFLTKQKTIASLKNADGIDAPEYIVTALKGSTSQMYVEKILPKARIVTTANYNEALDLVLQDKAHVMVADYHFLRGRRHPLQGERVDYGGGSLHVRSHRSRDAGRGSAPGQHGAELRRLSHGFRRP